MSSFGHIRGRYRKNNRKCTFFLVRLCFSSLEDSSNVPHVIKPSSGQSVSVKEKCNMRKHYWKEQLFVTIKYLYNKENMKQNDDPLNSGHTRIFPSGSCQTITCVIKQFYMIVTCVFHHEPFCEDYLAWLASFFKWEKFLGTTHAAYTKDKNLDLTSK